MRKKEIDEMVIGRIERRRMYDNEGKQRRKNGKKKDMIRGHK